ncbi:MAG: TM2 domain-containing protein [Syntrophaceae bacterium]|nr:TM2 domain-containing protein [Syntrophaceae bacterium]NTW76780.1 TM2 domain-containing protein [Syntrophaceae bacterium]
MIRQPIVPITLPLEYKSRGVAILLSLLFGGIGAHKFYVDKPRSGILYLLFCWTFIPSVFGIIEAIQYGSMRNDDFQQKYKTKKL